MEVKMKPERETDLWAGLEEVMGPAPKRARPATLICVDGRIIADAVVIVSPSDPNWWRGMAVKRNGEIVVRRQ